MSLYFNNENIVMALIVNNYIKLNINSTASTLRKSIPAMPVVLCIHIDPDFETAASGCEV